MTPNQIAEKCAVEIWKVTQGEDHANCPECDDNRKWIAEQIQSAITEALEEKEKENYKLQGAVKMHRIAVDELQTELTASQERERKLREAWSGILSHTHWGDLHAGDCTMTQCVESCPVARMNEALSLTQKDRKSEQSACAGSQNADPT